MHKTGRSEEVGAQPESKIIFLRIPKTASYTLRNLVSRQYRNSPTVDTDFALLTAANWQRFTQKLAAVPPETRAQYRVILGHMKFGLHEFLPGPSRYVTFLRHPVKRFASYYYMLRRLGLVPPEHQFDLSRSDWNLPAYETIPRELDNGQTRALANADWDLPFGRCSEEHFEAAKANLDRHFAFVGLTEHFDLSLMLLKRLCGWRWHFYVPKNVTTRSMTHPRISPEVLDAFVWLNRFDDRLYAYARERFKENIARFGLSLQLECAAYKSCNLLHRGFHAVYRPLKLAIRGKKSEKPGLNLSLARDEGP